jgi:hypothetical protein
MAQLNAYLQGFGKFFCLSNPYSNGGGCTPELSKALQMRLSGTRP